MAATRLQLIAEGLLASVVSIAVVRSHREARAGRGARLWWAVPGAEIPLDLVLLIEAREARSRRGRPGAMEPR